MEEEMRKHTKIEYPSEACGLVVEVNGIERYIPCKNIADRTSEEFIIDPIDYADAEDLGKIKAVFHSHPDWTEKPSEGDLVACEETKIPWIILSWPGNKFYRFAPKGYSVDLLGRPFYYGILDCCTLWRDIYKRELSIDFQCIDKSGRYPEYNWWEEGKDYYIENFEPQGFVKLIDTKPEKYDVFLIKLASKVANHAAVYMGGGIIIHHVLGKLSTKEIYGGYWQKHTVHHLRHESLC